MKPLNEELKYVSDDPDEGRRYAKLQAQLKEEREEHGLQLAACDCAAMMDLPETHEENKTATRDNPAWSPAFDSVMRRTAECIKLRAELAALHEARKEWESRIDRANSRAHNAEQENTKLRAELAAAREDTELIDWLASQYWKYHEEDDQVVASRSFTLCMPVGVPECPNDLRAAIKLVRDAARKGTS